MYLERYNVENETISFRNYELFGYGSNWLIGNVKRIQSESPKTTRNVLMMFYGIVYKTDYYFFNEICSNDENVKFIQSTKDL